MLQELEKFAYATSLDLNMGYYTIRLHPDSQKLCTIVTPLGKVSVLKTTNGNIMFPRYFSIKDV
jgi:hypothetical protein